MDRRSKSPEASATAGPILRSELSLSRAAMRRAAQAAVMGHNARCHPIATGLVTPNPSIDRAPTGS